MSTSRDAPRAEALRRLIHSGGYRTLMETQDLGVFFLDIEGHYVFVNPKIEELTGYSADEFYNDDSMGYTITHPDDHPVGRRAFRKALLGKSTQHHEFRLVHRNGEYRWTSAACYSVYGDDGNVLGIQVVIQDITDQKESQEALLREYEIRDAEAAIRVRVAEMEEPSDLLAVVAEISDQLARLGVGHDSCSIQVCNADGTDFLSCPRRDHLASIEHLETIRNLAWAPISDHMQLYPWVGEVWRTGKSRYVPATDEHSNLPVGLSLVDVAFSHGTLAINKCQTHAYSEADIALVERLAAPLSEGFKRFADITQRRALEDQLRESQKMEAVGQLTAGVSHNFNNMLMMIVGNIEMARHKGADAAREHLDAAMDASDRAASVIKQLMLLSRHGDGRKEPTDIGALAGQAVEICRRTFDPRISIHLHADEGLPQVMGSAGQLQQVVMNMCLNARDALEGVNGADPRLEVKVTQDINPPVPAYLGEPSGRYLCLVVRDNGSGMDALTRARAFEPFFTTKEVGRGTGLGLSTAYAIVRGHNGWIDIDSQPGTGTAFSVYLPVVHSGSISPQRAASEPAAGAGQTVLVVEDVDNIREVVCTMLEGAGYKTLQSSDGKEALEVLERLDYKVSLVLLDLSMPRVSGREVLDRIAIEAPQLKVVIFTGRDSGSVDTSGAVAVINKPVQREPLLHTVANVLNCSESA